MIYVILYNSSEKESGAEKVIKNLVENFYFELKKGIKLIRFDGGKEKKSMD